MPVRLIEDLVCLLGAGANDCSANSDCALLSTALMENNMVGVGNILGNLKSMATDMGSEIEKQNKQLDLIQGKVMMVVLHYSICILCLVCRLQGQMSGLSRLTRGLRNFLNNCIRISIDEEINVLCPHTTKNK